MRLSVSAKPRARQNLVSVVSDDSARLIVHTTQPADKGKANDAVLKLIAEHFGVGISKVTLISGATSRTKVVDVDI